MKSWTGTLVLFATMAVAIWVARRFLLVVRVDGTSMTPTFEPGEAVLARRVGRRTTVQTGQILVCRLPDGVPGPPGLLIKRVAAVAGQPSPDSGQVVPPGYVYVRGDGPRSYDSRQFGPLPIGSVVGKVIARLHPRLRH